MSHSRRWCTERKVSVPSSARDRDTCPVCGLPFDDVVSEAEIVLPDDASELESLTDDPDPVWVPHPQSPDIAAQVEPTGPRAGWYEDPSGSANGQRYWDGAPGRPGLVGTLSQPSLWIHLVGIGDGCCSLIADGRTVLTFGLATGCYGRQPSL